MKINKGSLGIIIAVQCCIYVSLILFRLLYEGFDNQAESLIYPFSCLLFGLTIYSFWSWYILIKSLFNPYLIFLLSAFLFNGGQTMLEVFHLNKDGILGDLPYDLPYLSSVDILYTIFLVIIGLGGFHLGALVSLVKVKSPNWDSGKTALIFSKNSYLIGRLLLCISLIPTIYTLRNSVLVVMSSGYHSLYETDASTSFSATPEILGDFLIPGAFFLLVGSKEIPKGKLISVSMVVIYAMIKFFLGERNQAIMPLISLAWIWHQLISPIPKTFLLSIGSLIGFVVLPLVATTRNTAGQDRLSISALLEQFSSIENPFIASISEIGGSMLTVAYTLQIVPSQRDFQMGIDYLYALLTIIPNIFGKLHPTVARGLPDHWLAEQINPYFASINGSYGFSFIAEAYLSFGWVGAPIALGVIGFLFAKLTLWAITSDNPAKIAMVASYLSFFIFYARAESALIVRSLVWYSLFPYLCVCVLNSSYSTKKLARQDKV